MLVTGGHINDISSLVDYTCKNGKYKAVTPHGTLHSPKGRFTPFSKTDKAPRRKAIRTIHEKLPYHTDLWSVEDYERAENKERFKTVPQGEVKLIKARYVKARKLQEQSKGVAKK